jgi:hypothetical protein
VPAGRQSAPPRDEATMTAFCDRGRIGTSSQRQAVPVVGGQDSHRKLPRVTTDAATRSGGTPRGGPGSPALNIEVSRSPNSFWLPAPLTPGRTAARDHAASRGRRRARLAAAGADLPQLLGAPLGERRPRPVGPQELRSPLPPPRRPCGASRCSASVRLELRLQL